MELWDSQMDVHVKGTFLGTKPANPEMRKVGGGSIVNISSIYGIIGSHGSIAYHAAKEATRLFAKSAAIQYAKENIRVNSVHPSFADTPMTNQGFQDAERLTWVVSCAPVGWAGSANEIAYVLLYLASDESSFMAGSALVIYGGLTAQ